jgi:predicted nucleotidyltransferase
MDTSVVIDVLRQALEDLEAVYLFGSQATAGARNDSDVDVALLASAPVPPDVRWTLQERLAALLHRSVDLVDLMSASTVFRAQVVGRGTVLYERDAARRHRFEGRALAEYARLNEERREILERVGRDGRIYA